MARRQAVEADDDFAWSTRAVAQLQRAAWYGFRDDAIEWDPPGLAERQPTRGWCASFYDYHRDRIVESCEGSDRHSWETWAVATFESTGRLQTDAARSVKAHAEHLSWLREHVFDVWLDA